MDLSSVLQFGFVVGILSLIFGIWRFRHGRQANLRVEELKVYENAAAPFGVQAQVSVRNTGWRGGEQRRAVDRGSVRRSTRPRLHRRTRACAWRIGQIARRSSRPSQRAAALRVGRLGRSAWSSQEKCWSAPGSRRVIVHAVRRRHRSPDYAVRTCESCGAQISGRSDRRFCSTRCRVSAHRALRRSDARDWRAAAWLLEHGWPELWGESSARRDHDIVRAQVANSPMRATTGNSRLTGDRESTELPSRSTCRPPLLQLETRGGNPTARQFLTGKCRIGGGTMRQPRRHRAPGPEQRDEV